MMLGDLEAGLGAIGLTLKGVVASAIGAFISLSFFKGLSFRERWVTFMGGFWIGAYGGESMTAALELSPRAELFVGLLLALFGMSISAAIIKVIRETDWKAVVRRKTGGGDGGGA